MKLQRVADKKIFDGFGVPEDRTRAAVPACLLHAVTAVDDTSGSLWVFADEGRLLAEAGDCVIHDGVKPIAVLKAGAVVKGWRPVAETQPRP